MNMRSMVLFAAYILCCSQLFPAIVVGELGEAGALPDYQKTQERVVSRGDSAQNPEGQPECGRNPDAQQSQINRLPKLTQLCVNILQLSTNEELLFNKVTKPVQKWLNDHPYEIEPCLFRIHLNLLIANTLQTVVRGELLQREQLGGISDGVFREVVGLFVHQGEKDQAFVTSFEQAVSVLSHGDRVTSSLELKNADLAEPSSESEDEIAVRKRLHELFCEKGVLLKSQVKALNSLQNPALIETRILYNLLLLVQLRPVHLNQLTMVIREVVNDVLKISSRSMEKRKKLATPFEQLVFELARTQGMPFAQRTIQIDSVCGACERLARNAFKKGVALFKRCLPTRAHSAIDAVAGVFTLLGEAVIDGIDGAQKMFPNS
jgi:hypothetical protein